MTKKYDGKYILKKPKDIGDHYRAYAIKDSAEELSAINASNTEPLLIKRSDYSARLVEGSSRKVVTPTGKYLMCVYELKAR
jgi:hypothetical protein